MDSADHFVSINKRVAVLFVYFITVMPPSMGVSLVFGMEMSKSLELGVGLRRTYSRKGKRVLMGTSFAFS